MMSTETSKPSSRRVSARRTDTVEMTAVATAYLQDIEAKIRYLEDGLPDIRAMVMEVLILREQNANLKAENTKLRQDVTDAHERRAQNDRMWQDELKAEMRHRQAAEAKLKKLETP